MTSWDISGIFQLVDTENNGKVSQKQWNDFYVAFITPFENADSEPRDGVLDEAEVKKSLEDIPVYLFYIGFLNKFRKK